MSNPKHLASIDRLRGIAITLVVLSHFFPYAKTFCPSPYGHDFSAISVGRFIFATIFCNGYLGVLFFFIVSGFCIRWSHLRAVNFSWKDFYLRRLFRIYPAYLFWLGVFAIISSACFGDTILHVLLAHNSFKETFYSINGPFWSIALEWQIYLLYPLIFAISQRVKLTNVLMLSALIGVLSWVSGTVLAAHLLQMDWISLLSRLPTSLLFPWMLGYYLANCLHADQFPRLQSWSLLVISVTALLIEFYLPLHVLRMLVWSLFACCVTITFLNATDKYPSKLGIAFERLGVISYSVYLGHEISRYVYDWIRQWVTLPQGTVFSGLVATMICLPVAVIIGWLSYLIFEVKGVNLGLRFKSFLVSRPK